MGGRKARCNKCQNVFTIPVTTGVSAAPSPPRPAPPGNAPRPPASAASGPRRPAAPAHRAVAPPGPRRAHAESEDGLPRRQAPHLDDAAGKKGFPVLLVSLLGGGVVLVIGVVVLLVVLLGGSSTTNTPGGNTPGGNNPGGFVSNIKEDLKYMPENLQILTGFNHQKRMDSPLVKTVIQGNSIIENDLKSARHVYGVAPEDVVTVLVGATKDPRFEGVMAIRTSKDYTPDQVLDNLGWKGHTDEEKEGAISIYTYKASNRAMCGVNGKKVLLATSAKTLKEVLARNGEPKQIPDEMKLPLDSINYSSDFFAVANPQKLETFKRHIFMTYPGFNQTFVAPQIVTLEHVYDAKLNGKENGYFKEEQLAANCTSVLKAGLDQTLKNPGLSPELKNFAAGTQIAQAGKQVVVSKTFEA
jgi:hypothetical protein